MLPCGVLLENRRQPEIMYHIAGMSYAVLVRWRKGIVLLPLFSDQRGLLATYLSLAQSLKNLLGGVALNQWLIGHACHAVPPQ